MKLSLICGILLLAALGQGRSYGGDDYGNYGGQNDWGSDMFGGYGNMWQKLMSYMKGGNYGDQTRLGSNTYGGRGPSSNGGYGGWDKRGDDKNVWQKMMSCILAGENYGEQNFISFVNQQIFANAERYLNSDGHGEKSTYGDRTGGSNSDRNDRYDGDMWRNMMSIMRNYGGQNGRGSANSGGYGSSGKRAYDGNILREMMSYIPGGNYGGQNDWGSDRSSGWRSSSNGGSYAWGKEEDDKKMWQKMMSCMQKPLGGNYGNQNFISFLNQQIFSNLEGYANTDGQGRKSEGEEGIKADLKSTIKQLIKVIIHRQSKVASVDQSRAKNCAKQCATDLACPNGTEISSHLASTSEMCQTCFNIACNDQQDSACFIVVRKACSKLCPSDVLESRKEEEKACTDCLKSCYDIDQEEDGDEKNGSHDQVSRDNTGMGDNDHQGKANVTQVQSSMGQSDE